MGNNILICKMKYIATLLVAGIASAHRVRDEPMHMMSQSSQDQINDLYSFSEKDNIKQEIEDAKMYMEKQKRAAAEDQKAQKIKAAYAAIEKEKKMEEEAQKEHYQKIMSLADAGDDTI